MSVGWKKKERFEIFLFRRKKSNIIKKRDNKTSPMKKKERKKDRKKERKKEQNKTNKKVASNPGPSHPRLIYAYEFQTFSLSTVCIHINILISKFSLTFSLLLYQKKLSESFLHSYWKPIICVVAVLVLFSIIIWITPVEQIDEVGIRLKKLTARSP